MVLIKQQDGCLNIKILCYQFRNSHHKKLRRPYYHPIFMLGIPIPGKTISVPKRTKILKQLSCPESAAYSFTPSQWTHDVIITSLLLQNDIIMSFFRNNDAIFTFCARWDVTRRSCTTARSVAASSPPSKDERTSSTTSSKPCWSPGKTPRSLQMTVGTRTTRGPALPSVKKVKSKRWCQMMILMKTQQARMMKCNLAYRWAHRPTTKILTNRWVDISGQGLYSLNGRTANLVKSQSHGIGCYNDRIALKFDRQRCCRGACQISELEKSKPESRGFESSRDRMIRRASA